MITFITNENGSISIFIKNKTFGMTIKKNHFSIGSVAMFYSTNNNSTQLYLAFLDALNKLDIKYILKSGWSTSSQFWKELTFEDNIDDLKKKLK